MEDELNILNKAIILIEGRKQQLEDELKELYCERKDLEHKIWRENAEKEEPVMFAVSESMAKDRIRRSKNA